MAAKFPAMKKIFGNLSHKLKYLIPSLTFGVLASELSAQSLRYTGSWTSNANGSLADPSRYYRTAGSGAAATAVRNTGNNTISSITLTNPGSGYLQTPAVIITGGNGTGALAVANMNPNGTVASITVTNPGSGYTGTPAVLIAPIPGGIGSTGIFNTDITANRVLTLDGNRTFGRMIVGDLSSTQIYTFNEGTGGSFIFDNGNFAGGMAYLNKFQGGADVINAGVSLQNDTLFRVTTSRLDLRGTISGNRTISSSGNGVLGISGNNTGTNLNLSVWNRGTNTTSAQVELGATTGNAISGNIIIGNATYGTSGHAVLQLLQGRSNLDQISDTATLIFDSINGVGRNAYFKLMGGNETVGRILDIGDRAIIENREAEGVSTGAILTIAGNLDSRISGFVRDNNQSNILQEDSNAALTGGARLGITKTGAGNLTLAGGNIIYSGNTLVSQGTLTLQNTTNFRSNITNNSHLAFSTTGTLNMRKVFQIIPGSDPARTYADQYLSISGTGSVSKTGNGTLGIFGPQTIGGSFSMDNGTLTLHASETGISIGGGLRADGDSTLNRNINLHGNVSITGGLLATGRFNTSGSTVRIAGAVLGRGDQEAGIWVDAVTQMNGGNIDLRHTNLVLESNYTVNKTTTGTTSSSNVVTLTNSADLLNVGVTGGMRVTGNGIPAGTTVTNIDFVNRRVTLSQNVSVASGTTLTFSYSTNTDGRITGTPTNITISGNTSAIAAAAGGTSLILSNTNLSNNNNRIPDSTPIISNGGLFEFRNNATAQTFSETIGNLVLNTGSLQLVGYRAASGGTSTLTFNQLQRNAGSVVEFGGRQLLNGNTTIESDSLGVDTRNRIMFTTAPTMINGIVAGWAYANNEWVKYGVNGITPLVSTDYSFGGEATWVSSNNIKISAANITTTARRTINSLNIQPATTAAVAGRTLTLNANRLDIVSGGIITSHGDHTINATSGFVTAGTDAPGARELIAIVGTSFEVNTNRPLSTVRVLTMNARIDDYTISRNVTVANNSTNVTLTSGTTAGLTVGMAFFGSNIPDDTVITAITSDTTLTISKAVSPGISNSPRDFGTPRSVSLVKAGAGSLRLNNPANNYTGSTVISNGTLLVGGITSLGAIPNTFRADHFRIDGGNMQLARRTDNTTDTAVNSSTGLVPDKIFDFNDGMRGFTIGTAGGRLEVGVNNPNNNPTGTTGEPVVRATITNPIYAEGVLELAVRANAALGQFNTLTIGNSASTNTFLSGIRSEGGFPGIISINGNNTIGGLVLEGADMTLTGNNNFTDGIRLTSGTLTLTSANTFLGGQDFPTINMTTGVLRIQHPQALGGGPIKAAMGNGGRILLIGNNQTISEISGGATSSIENQSASEATLTFDLSYNQTYAGQLNNGSGQGRLNITKTGPGTLNLTSVQSSFSGVVRINQGAIDVTTMPFYGVSSPLGSSSEIGGASQLVLDGGVLSFTLRAQQFTDRSFTLGAGANAGALVANGATRAARIIMGANFELFGELISSPSIGFEGTGSRVLTLGGNNVGLNTLALELGNKSLLEPSALQKIGPGVWLLDKANNYSGQTTIVDGVLMLQRNYSAGTNSLATTASASNDTFTGNLPNGTELSFPRFNNTTLPAGIFTEVRYYVVQSNATNGTFKVSLTPGGSPIDILSSGTSVTYVPNFKSTAITSVLNDNYITDRFVGNLPNGTAIRFGTRLVGGGSNTFITPLLPGGIASGTTYFVINSDGASFQVSATLGGSAVNLTDPGDPSRVLIYYEAEVPGNNSEGIYVMGGRLDLGNVDYLAPETIYMNGGGLGVPRNTNASWSGNVQAETNSNWTIGLNSTFTLNGNILGNRTINQLGEGTVILKGETLTIVTQSASTSDPNNRTDAMDASRANYTLQAGTLVLDYSVNNNSKLTDNATFTMGGGRRGGILRLSGGTHQELVNALSLQPGASQIYRDSGSSVIYFNTITRNAGSSLYFDKPGIAKVDVPNVNGILGGWAIIRDARVDAYAVVPGTVSRSFVLDPVSGMLTVPDDEPVHYLAAPVPVRFTSTGTLPGGLQTNTTYFVADATARAFRVSTTPFGTPVIITTEGTGQHTVETYAPPYVGSGAPGDFPVAFSPIRRQGPASLIFRAKPQTFPGTSGNRAIWIRIVYSASGSGVTAVYNAAGGTVESPTRYTITVRPGSASAFDIEDFVSIDSRVAGVLSVTQTGPVPPAAGADLVQDTGTYGQLLFGGGIEDTGGQSLSWARNASTTPGNFNDGPVESVLEYSTTWGVNQNTDVIGGSAPLDITEGSVTYTLRYSNALSSILNLTKNAGDLGHTLQTGAILISPTVGVNDTVITGDSFLRTNNEGNLQNFLFHQYNTAGDLVVAVPLTERQSFTRLAKLSAGNLALITGLVGIDGTGNTNQLSVGMSVSGTGIPAGATIAEIIDQRTIRISVNLTGSDNVRNVFTFDGGILMLGSARLTQQSRITAVRQDNHDLKTTDIYVGMGVSGQGIPPGATVASIVNDSDITLNVNHVYNGMDTELTFTPSAGVEKLGQGTLILNAASTYTGSTFLADGVLRIQTLRDGGVAGSLGASTNAAANLAFNGGSLQYVGATSSTNRNITLSELAEVNIGHERTLAVFSGNISGADVFAKSGSGTLEMRGNAGLAEIRVSEGKLRIQGVDTNLSPATYSQSNFGQTGLGELRLSGGTFEFRGAAEGNTTLTLGGQLFVDAGASEIRAIGVPGFNPNNIASGAVPRTTQLNLMGGEELTSVARSVGGTVRFVEEPESGGAVANITLNIQDLDRGRVLPWAVYLDTTNITQPGINNFAAVSLLNGGVISADAASIYDLGSFFMNANNWGTQEAASTIDASEGGLIEVILENTEVSPGQFENGVNATAGSNILVVSETRVTAFNQLIPDMRAFGPGLEPNTKIVSLLTNPLRVVLSKPAISTHTNARYTFLRERSYFGTLTGDRSLNTLRYFTPVDSSIQVPAGTSIQLLSGAILMSANVRGGQKEIVGAGSISGAVGATDGSDLVIHNYNTSASFKLGVNVVDNVLTVSGGNTSAGSNIMIITGQGIQFYNRIKEGMVVSGPGIPPGTTVTGKEDYFRFVYMSASATTSEGNKIFTFRDVTSFVQTGIGTTLLSGTNSYGGKTFVNGGVLRLESALAVPGGIGMTGGTSAIVVKGGVLGLGHSDFLRDIGTGSNQIEFQGSGGFAAYGANRVVNFGGKTVPDLLRYGNEGFVPDGSSFVLGAHDATHTTIVLNPIDLGSFSQAIRINDGPAEIEGELAGGMTGLGRLIKFGGGTLKLNASSNHSGGIEIAAGRLIGANVENVFGIGSGQIELGVDLTNTQQNAVTELVVEGGDVAKNLRVGNVNSRGLNWINRGATDASGVGSGSQSSSLVVNGNPAVAYYDPNGGDLKYVRASDARGTSWLPAVTVATGIVGQLDGDVGQFPSLCIINGNPAISYYDTTNKMPMFVRSTDISGAVWGAPVVVDSSSVNSIALQSTGRAVIGGSFEEFDGVLRSRMARLNTDGTLDSAFSPNVNGEVLAVVVQNDDKIVIAGSFTFVNGTQRNRIARLNADGSLDNDYNPNLNGIARGLLIEPDGRLLVWGSFTGVGVNGRNRLARINVNGTLDSFHPNANGEVRSVARQSDGKLVLGGAFTTVGGLTRNRMARVSSTGAVDADATFLSNMNNTVSAVAVLPNGKILIGGIFTNHDTSGRRRDRLARLNADGRLDQSFVASANAEVTNLIVLPDGKAIAVGLFTEIGNRAISGVARILEDGNPLAATNAVDDAFNANPNDRVNVVLPVADSKFLVGGGFTNIGGSTRHFLARIESTGGGDSTYLRAFVDRGRHTSLAMVRQAANAGIEVPAIAYYDVNESALRFARAADANGTNWELSLALDNSGDVGHSTAMKMVNVGGDLITKNTTQNNVTITGSAINGTPGIAYYDVTNGNLKYILANNAAGTDWSAPVVVESAGDVGSHLSMTLVNGFPAIAYYSTTAGLKYIRATNSAGVTNNLRVDGNIVTRAISALVYQPAWGSSVVVDASSNDIGRFASLEVITDGTSAQGRPAIAYYDAAVAARNLKYVRSLDVNGAAWGVAQTVVSAGDVGQNAALLLTDGVPGIVYLDATANDLKFLHLADASGYSRLELADGVDWQGDITLDGNLFVDVTSGAMATISGILQGDAGFKLASGGTLLLNNSGNSFGSDLSGVGAPISSAVVVRSGTLALGVNGAIGAHTVELGDSTPQILTVERATTFASLTALSGRFDADHNGFFDNAGGPGAFVNIDTTIDGRTYVGADQGTLILVKDERDNPQWNGVYQVIFLNTDDQPDGTMNLARVAAMDSVAELAYGTQVRVLNGTHAGQSFFIASTVVELNASAVHWMRDYADGNTALLAASSGLTISNPIDINGGNGSGLAILGTQTGVTTGTTTFQGNVVLQNLKPGVRETKTVALQSFSNTGEGVIFTGSFSEANGGAGGTNDAMSLQKIGSGTVTLKGASSISGTVTVQEGTLLVGNTAGTSATGSGAVTVNAGAVLGGTGFIGGAVTLSGSAGNKAILRPGDFDTTTVTAGETLTINAPLTVGADSVVEFAVGVNHFTRLVANSISVSGTGQFLVQLLDGYVPPLDTVLNLVDGAITLAPGANLRDHLVLPGELAWDTSQFLTQGTIRALGATVPVQIVTQPAVILPVSGSPVNPGGSVTVTLRATVSGSTEFAFQWQKSPIGAGTYVNVGPVVFSSSTQANFTLNGVFEADEADYRLVATNGGGIYTAVSNPVSLIVNDPPVISQSPASVTVNPGGTATFTVVATGPGPLSYEWRRGTTVLAAPTEGLSTFQITNVQKSAEGSNYNVRVTNGATSVTGPVQSAFFSITVRDPVVITSFPSTLEVSAGESATITVGHSGSATPDLPVPGTPAFIYEWERDTGSGFEPVAGATNSPQLTLPTVAPSENGHIYRVRVSNSFSTDSRTVVMTVSDGPPTFRTQPQSRTVIAGTPLTLEVETGGSAIGRVYQWKRGKARLRDGAGITGVNTPTLHFSAIDLKQAGDYSCDVTNSSGLRTSQVAFVAVVGAPGTYTPIQVGRDITLTVPFSAPKGVTLGFKWKKQVGTNLREDLPASDRIASDSLARLVIRRSESVSAGGNGDSGTYICEVTGPGPIQPPGETVDGGLYDVRVFDKAPVLIPEPFPAAMVGAPFTYPVKVDSDPTRAPTTFAARGLPAGLRIDAKTGLITGTPRSAAQNVPVTLSVSNTFSRPAITETLLMTVQAVPELALGAFTGWLPRNQALNDFMGGRFELTVAPTAAYSGRVTLGTVAYPFKGALSVDPEGGFMPTATVSIPRRGRPVPPPLTLTFTINISAAPLNQANRLASAKIEDGTHEIEFDAWRNVTVLSEFTSPANSSYNFALLPPSGAAIAGIPEGSGYGSFTVAPNRTLRLAGRTADGQAVTGSTFVGPLGEVLVYQPLYASKLKGSLQGHVQLLSSVPSENSDNKVTGTLEWNCPANDAKNNFTYRDGFGNTTPVEVSAKGGFYSMPVAPELILGLLDGENNAVLVFEGGGVEDSEINPSLNGPDLERPVNGFVSVRTGNRLITPPAKNIGENDGLTKISVVARTGVFKGDFTLKDFPLGGVRQDSRKTAFTGIIVDDDDGQEGASFVGTGYYLLRQHPNHLPITVPPTTLRNSPIRSGQVIFEAR